jgi:hypothetical protein
MRRILGKWLISLGRKLLLTTEVYSLYDRNTTVVHAGGTKGILLPSKEGCYFRTYYEDGTFTDYRINHSDLSIIIDEDYEASFYHTSGQDPILDHAPEVLGYKTIRIPS